LPNAAAQEQIKDHKKMPYKILDNINSSRDVSNLDESKLEELCSEVRKFIIDNVSKTGGHLSANLGTVELITGMHHCFSTPVDRFVFDVGHQSYTHKIFTGRKDEFYTLRKLNGISGFPSPAESDEDSFVAGHGSNSIAVSIGLAYAKKLKNEPGYVVDVIGDGAFTGGMAYEGLNNVSAKLDNLIIILNDNKMSISKNVGAIPRYLSRLRTDSDYLDAKQNISQAILKVPVIGESVNKILVDSKSVIRRRVYSSSTFFEELGFTYYQILNGNDIYEVCDVLKAAKRVKGPVFIHAFTKKGKGYLPAEENPGEFHGVSPFIPEKLHDPDIAPKDSYSNEFGKHLSILANENEKICAITAAMKYGTGLQFFYKDHPQRFFDVGMAEEYAVTFRAALAKGGMQPVICLYSTFMQRALDQYLNDTMLLNLDVMFAIDRAGIVPGDGETHQGVFDIGIFSNYEKTPIICPSNYNELLCWQKKLLNEFKGPKVIRYSRGGEDSVTRGYKCTGREFDLIKSNKNTKNLIVCYGRHFALCIKAVNALKENDLFVDILKLNMVHPMPENAVKLALGYENIHFYEEQIRAAGVWKNFSERLFKYRYKGNFTEHPIENYTLRRGSVEELMKLCKLDSESIVKDFRDKIEN
jgi:1-deoxy-D-xylulose-5-phosphate synthase